MGVEGRMNSVTIIQKMFIVTKEKLIKLKDNINVRISFSEHARHFDSAWINEHC